jgi:hypothetical protein
MKFTQKELDKVQFSRKDEIKGIKIPTKLTKELAEDIGIHVGDGSLYKYNSGNLHYGFLYSGNVLEKEYIEYIIKLKKKLYNLSKIRKYKYGNELRFIFHSLALATFYSNVIGLPIGKKRFIDVPNVIKENTDEKIITSFLRGLIDTDFGLILRNKYGKIYPSLEGTSISRDLIISVSELFSRLEIPFNLSLDIRRFDKRTKKYYVINKIIIQGYKRINKVIRKIGFSNTKYKKRMMGLGRFEFGGTL